MKRGSEEDSDSLPCRYSITKVTWFYKSNLYKGDANLQWLWSSCASEFEGELEHMWSTGLDLLLLFPESAFQLESVLQPLLKNNNQKTCLSLFLLFLSICNNLEYKSVRRELRCYVAHLLSRWNVSSSRPGISVLFSAIAWEFLALSGYLFDKWRMI